MLRRNGGHSQKGRQRGRLAAQPFQRRSQPCPHGGLVHAQHHHVDGSALEDVLVGSGEAGGGDGGQVLQVTVPGDARRRIPEETALGLPHAVKALVVDLALQLTGEGGFFDVHRLGGKLAVLKIGLKGHAEGQSGIFGGEALPFQGELVLDAGDADAQHPAGALHEGGHGEVRAVELGQLAGEGGHVRAGGIAPLQHQRQQGVVGGRGPGGGEAEVDGKAAAVEFIRRQGVQPHAGGDGFGV